MQPLTAAANKPTVEATDGGQTVIAHTSDGDVTFTLNRRTGEFENQTNDLEAHEVAIDLLGAKQSVGKLFGRSVRKVVAYSTDTHKIEHEKDKNRFTIQLDNTAEDFIPPRIDNMIKIDDRYYKITEVENPQDTNTFTITYKSVSPVSDGKAEEDDASAAAAAAAAADSAQGTDPETEADIKKSLKGMLDDKAEVLDIPAGKISAISEGGKPNIVISADEAKALAADAGESVEDAMNLTDAIVAFSMEGQLAEYRTITNVEKKTDESYVLTLEQKGGAASHKLPATFNDASKVSMILAWVEDEGEEDVTETQTIVPTRFNTNLGISSASITNETWTNGFHNTENKFFIGANKEAFMHLLGKEVFMLSQDKTQSHQFSIGGLEQEDDIFLAIHYTGDHIDGSKFPAPELLTPAAT